MVEDLWFKVKGTEDGKENFITCATILAPSWKTCFDEGIAANVVLNLLLGFRI